MAGKLTVNPIQLNDSATDSNNFLLSQSGATMKLARGATGTLGDILTVDASGNVNTTNALTQGSVAVPRMVLATAQNTTSGTSIDFTGIPSWVKRITVMFNGVSTNGSSKVRIQLGAGSVETSGYAGSASAIASASASSANFSAGFDVSDTSTAARSLSGALTFTLLGSNLWVCSGNLGDTASTYQSFVGGTKTTSGTLDRLRVTTANGTDTFDAGSVNVMYEG